MTAAFNERHSVFMRHVRAGIADEFWLSAPGRSLLRLLPQDTVATMVMRVLSLAAFISDGDEESVATADGPVAAALATAMQQIVMSPFIVAAASAHMPPGWYRGCESPAPPDPNVPPQQS